MTLSGVCSVDSADWWYRFSTCMVSVTYCPLLISRPVPSLSLASGMERYDHYNVLEDVDFKEGIKKFS